MFDVMDKRQTGYEFFTVGLMWQLFGQILYDRSYTVTDMSERRNAKSTEQIKTVLNYIRKNYASRLTLADLADVLNLSQEHFLSAVSLSTGKSPIDYLNYYRN